MATIRHPDHDEETGGVILSPDEEADLTRRLAETDESEKAGLLIRCDGARF